TGGRPRPRHRALDGHQRKRRGADARLRQPGDPGPGCPGARARPPSSSGQPRGQSADRAGHASLRGEGRAARLSAPGQARGLDRTHLATLLHGPARNSPVSGTALVLLAGTGVVAIADWVAVVASTRRLEYVAKPAVMIGLIAVALALRPPGPPAPVPSSPAGGPPPPPVRAPPPCGCGSRARSRATGWPPPRPPARAGPRPGSRCTTATHSAPLPRGSGTRYPRGSPGCR